VEPACVSEMILRLAAGTQEELKSLDETYRAFLFAFPGKPNQLIESAHQLQSSILGRALGKIDSYIVRHPYPVYFPALHEAMRPFCDAASAPVYSEARTKKMQTARALASAALNETAESV